MPSTITHTYIGFDTIENISLKPKKILTKNVNNFKIYCQGADVFYFYKILLLRVNNVQKLGHIFHNDNTLGIFKYLIDLNKINHDDELFTFICGLVTHYKADSIMHPYINYLSYTSSKLGRIDNHFRVETYIDNYLISNKEKTNPKKYRNYKMVFNYTKENIIINTLNDLFMHFYNTNNMGNIYYKALSQMHFVFKYLRYDPTGIKKTLYKIVDLNHLSVRKTKYLSYNFDLDNDRYLNKEHNTWFNYNNRKLTSNKSFFELYEQVIEESTSIINNLYQYIFENKKIDLNTVIGNYSYSTGLVLKK